VSSEGYKAIFPKPSSIWFAVAALALLAIASTAHAQTLAQQAPIVLRIGGAGGFTLPTPDETAPRYRADRAIVEAFEHQHPEIRLESAQGLTIQGPAAESGLLLEFAGGTAPDVVYVNFRESATYVKQGFLMPLDSEIDQHPDVMQRVNPLIRKVLLDIGHGHIYSIPYAQYVLGLYYRKDYFAAAGLDPTKPPTTWDEFYDDAKKLTDQKKGVWGFEFGKEADAAYWWVDFLWQAGGDVIKRDSSGKWVAAFDTPEGVTALEFYSKLLSAPWKGPDGKTYIGVAKTTDDVNVDKAAGRMAMWFQYQSNVIANMTDASTLNPNVIGIAPMPKGPTGITANELNASMWGISSQITDPRVRQAAWEFVQFMSSDDADRIRTKSYVDAGLGDTVNPLSLRKYGYEDYLTPQSHAWLEANRTLMQFGHPEPYGDNMNQIYNLLAVPLGTIALNPSANPRALLDRAAKEVNEKLTGYVDPRVMAQRRAGAWALFIVFMLTVGVFFVRYCATLVGELHSSFSSGGGSSGRSAAKTPRAHILAWIFMLPAILTVLVWAYYPLMHGLMMAFQDYHIIGRAQWIGMDNFIDAFHEHSFWLGVETSFLFTVYSLVLGFFLPIFLALGLSEIPVGKMLYRTLYYMPSVTSGLIVGFLFKQFESKTPPGIFDTLLSSLSMGHIPKIDWLDDPHWALLACVVPRIWASAGPGCIIYLAALKGVSEEMYEAADLDGAGIWAKICKITLPTLKPLILINLIGAVIGAFQATDTILVMTGGGPVNATSTLGLEIFYNAFLYLRFGYATSVAWVMGALLIGFTLFQLRIMKDIKFSAAGA
jgi:ABC-type sugar transport system permease subunit/ABC-type glycerol-3-phosphate transport system substrate-binding protein